MNLVQSCTSVPRSLSGTAPCPCISAPAIIPRLFSLMCHTSFFPPPLHQLLILSLPSPLTPHSSPLPQRHSPPSTFPLSLTLKSCELFSTLSLNILDSKTNCCPSHSQPITTFHRLPPPSHPQPHLPHNSKR